MSAGLSSTLSVRVGVLVGFSNNCSGPRGTCLSQRVHVGREEGERERETEIILGRGYTLYTCSDRILKKTIILVVDKWTSPLSM